MASYKFGQLTRRRFMQCSAAVASSLALPRWFVEELHGQTLSNKALQDANDQPALALVGCGGRGRGVASEASNFGRVIAVCDVDDRQLAEAQKTWPDATPYKDFRKVMEDPRAVGVNNLRKVIIKATVGGV